MATSDEYLKKAFETTTGIHPLSDASVRPSSGFVITGSQMEKKRQDAKARGANYGPDAVYELEDSDVFGDGLTAMGDIQVVLRPEVSKRTSYMRGGAIASGGRPVAMNSDNKEDIFDAIINSDGPNKKANMADAIINLLKARVGKQETVNTSRKLNTEDQSSIRSNQAIEAQILGGYSLSDIEGIYFPFSRVEKISQSTDISDVLRSVIKKEDFQKDNISQTEINSIISKINSGEISTPSSSALKNYRTAMQIRSKYTKRGIGYVLFAHRDGINIDSPKSYDPSSRPNESVEDVLSRKIKLEVATVMKKIVSQIREG